MGSCLCKQQKVVTAAVSRSSLVTIYSMDPYDSTPRRRRINALLPNIDELIIEVLRFVRRVHNGGEEAPALALIHQVSDTEEGWCFIMMALIESIPMDDVMVPTTVKMIFDSCPLPVKDTIIGFIQSLNLCRDTATETYADDNLIVYARNLLLVLDCIADRFAGPICVQIMTDDLLDYLITFLADEACAELALHALLALERLAVSSAARGMADRAMARQLLHPLLPLELHHDSPNPMWRQVGFCARWALDNVFFVPGRQLTYENTDMSGIHVTLNPRDMSSNIKLSPDGLEARCDSHLFESVRATYEITYGVWYYEVEVLTGGVMQIGWATKATSFGSQEGLGVGDDDFSLGYDGCRRLVWHRAFTLRHEKHTPRWAPGDILGCLIDVPKASAIFYLNGRAMPTITDIFEGCRLKIQFAWDPSSEGFFAAASFMAHQHCRFNFGSRPFKYPPTDYQFRNMNDFGRLAIGQRRVVPRHVLLKSLREHPETPYERACVVCLGAEGTFGVGPCCHRNIGYCDPCMSRLHDCPVCRRRVVFTFPMSA